MLTESCYYFYCTNEEWRFEQVKGVFLIQFHLCLLVYRMEIAVSLFLRSSNGTEKTQLQAGYWWLKPVILATLEAEIRRIAVRSQSRQIVGGTLSRKNPSQKKGACLARVRPSVQTPVPPNQTNTQL
jgi:hypothetical protein